VVRRPPVALRAWLSTLRRVRLMRQGEAVWIANANTRNFFHWMLDALPKLMLLMELR
jgi:hypothetical protein